MTRPGPKPIRKTRTLLTPAIPEDQRELPEGIRPLLELVGLTAVYRYNGHQFIVAEAEPPAGGLYLDFELIEQRVAAAVFPLTVAPKTPAMRPDRAGKALERPPFMVNPWKTTPRVYGMIAANSTGEYWKLTLQNIIVHRRDPDWTFTKVSPNALDFAGSPPHVQNQMNRYAAMVPPKTPVPPGCSVPPDEPDIHQE